MIVIGFRFFVAAVLFMGTTLVSAATLDGVDRGATTMRVLVVGNSLVYVNNLPALVSAMAPPEAPIETDLLVAAGGDLAERVADGATAREIASGRWQVLVLQERGGLLACAEKPLQRDEPACRSSIAAHKKLAQLARARGMRVILLGTWGPDAIWQKQLSRSLRKIAAQTGAEAVDAGADLRGFGQRHPTIALYQDAGLHLTLDGSLRVAAGLIRQLSGQAPVARILSPAAPLYPVHILPDPTVLASAQPALAKNATTARITAEHLSVLLD
jgi:hypothetical protein